MVAAMLEEGGSTIEVIGGQRAAGISPPHTHHTHTHTGSLTAVDPSKKPTSTPPAGFRPIVISFLFRYPSVSGERRMPRRGVQVGRPEGPRAVSGVLAASSQAGFWDALVRLSTCKAMAVAVAVAPGLRRQ